MATNYLSQNSEYDEVNQEIQKTIQKQNDLYKKIQTNINGDYPDNRRDYQVSKKVGDLSEHSKKVWEFLDNRYDNNTQLKKSLFIRMNELENKSAKQQVEIDYLEDKRRQMQVNADTAKRHFEETKYGKDRFVYYVPLHQRILISLAVIILILGATYAGFIGKTAGLVSSVIIIAIMVCYGIYYIYVSNINRSNLDWNKYYYPAPAETVNSSNTPSYKSEDVVELTDEQAKCSKKLSEMAN